MLARLQQAIVLGLLALIGAWLLAMRHGPLWLVAAGVLGLACAHAVVLALEFLLMHRVNRADPVPRATGRELLRAWVAESLTAPRVFLWQQPMRSRRWADHLPATPSGQRGVVFVHGFVCNRGLWNPWMRELRRRGIPHVAVNLEPVFGSIDDYPPHIDAAVRQVAMATGRPPLVVAHSMGGLAVRRWWAGHGAGTPLARVITIGSPHAGTWLARFGATHNGRQMRRGGDWLAELASAERLARGAQPYASFTCFYTHCDNIVFPPSTATLPGADNRHVPGCAHVDLVFQPAVFSEACRWLSGAPPEAACNAR